MAEITEAPSGQFEKLFIVDDDTDVRELVTGVLSEIGYQIREASNGEEAISLLKHFTPDLMIIDFAMPGTNGAELARAVREKSPSLRILFMSGFADSSALDAAVGNAPVLRKPFRPAELAAAVRAALE